jgi:hypothetical protein
MDAIVVIDLMGSRDQSNRDIGHCTLDYEDPDKISISPTGHRDVGLSMVWPKKVPSQKVAARCSRSIMGADISVPTASVNDVILETWRLRLFHCGARR